MRVLVTGPRGLLGAAIVREFGRGHDVVPLDRALLDLTDGEAVARAVAAHRPQVIINCAAFSGVDAAEDRAAEALAVNALAVRALASAAGSVDCTFVHYGTDFVFDGEAGRPYSEEDRASPRGFYGLSKLLGEWFAADVPRAYVLRVESLFGVAAPGSMPRGSVHGIVQRILAGEEVPVFTDRTVSPTYTADVATATRAIVERPVSPGLYHCVNSGAATWHAVAERAASLLNRTLRAKPMTLETAGLRAARPRYCALSNAKLAAAGVPMPSWEDALARYLREYVPR